MERWPHEFGCGASSDVVLAGFEHVDRNDVATIRSAKLVFSEHADSRTTAGTVAVKHVDRRSGLTQATFTPVTADTPPTAVLNVGQNAVAQ